MSEHDENRPCNLPDEVNKLIRQQKKGWELARKNYDGLKSVKTKTFDFEGFKIIAQFNPERIRSSAAKTDSKSIRKRPCFLCEKNKPQEQAGIDFNSNYSILINPFPIFSEHLTIPLKEHLPQEIHPYFHDLMKISKKLPQFTFFYNGPKCGASAPDHFHFQACTKNQIPIEMENPGISTAYGDLLFQDQSSTITAIGNGYLRKLIHISSKSEQDLIHHFKIIINSLAERGQEGEPMLNLLANFEGDRWEIILFPRDQQRPKQFFAEGNDQMLISPASVEMGGLIILPRKEDFEKLTKDDLKDIYNQVSMNDEDFEQLKEKLEVRL